MTGPADSIQNRLVRVGRQSSLGSDDHTIRVSGRSSDRRPRRPLYGWLRQEGIDRGEIEGVSADRALELAVARWRITQLETELAVARTRCS